MLLFSLVKLQMMCFICPGMGNFIKTTYDCRLVGTFQDETGFFTRFKVGEHKNSIFDFPIDSNQFHSLKLDQPVKLTIEAMQ